jgi:hypothetical protein
MLLIPRVINCWSINYDRLQVKNTWKLETTLALIGVVCMYVRSYVYVCMSVCLYVCMYVCMYASLYVYIGTLSRRRLELQIRSTKVANETRGPISAKQRWNRINKRDSMLHLTGGAAQLSESWSWRGLLKSRLDQGCQIFQRKTYQKGKICTK